MPNWCSTDIEIIGTREEMNKLAAIVNEAKEPGFLETICPSPNGDWDYAWSVENWGTKWDIGDGHAHVEDLATAHPILQARLTIATETAWAPPLEALGTYLENNPEFFVKCCYYEPGMDFAGIWEEGSDDCLQDLHDENIDWAEPGSLAQELDSIYGICEEHAQYDEEEEEHEDLSIRG